MRPLVQSSYDPAEVTFLLTDLSGADLELDTATREKLIQGGRNYAEMLPVEYAPPPEYLAVFEQLVEEKADRTAELVALLCEQLLDAYGPGITLVSLARAGTPVGILLRRWFATRGIEVPHYSVSIVRGVGIDAVALQHITDRHSADSVVFVDGWTGKGAIVTELREAVADLDVKPTLAVLADPGRCADFFGARSDELLASACLNSTVCGLVSRTVFNTDLLAPEDFHGAKVYAELAAHDRSARFLDSVSSRFPDVGDRWQAVRDGDRAMDFAGADEVRRIQQEHGLPTWHLVKPGVGETTRVLLRRMPWKVLIRPDADLQHIRMLAADKGVEVVEDSSLSYACMGLIKPLEPADT